MSDPGSSAKGGLNRYGSEKTTIADVPLPPKNPETTPEVVALAAFESKHSRPIARAVTTGWPEEFMFTQVRKFDWRCT